MKNLSLYMNWEVELAEIRYFDDMEKEGKG